MPLTTPAVKQKVTPPTLEPPIGSWGHYRACRGKSPAFRQIVHPAGTDRLPNDLARRGARAVCQAAGGPSAARPRLPACRAARPRQPGPRRHGAPASPKSSSSRSSWSMEPLAAFVLRGESCASSVCRTLGTAQSLRPGHFASSVRPLRERPSQDLTGPQSGYTTGNVSTSFAG